MSTTVFSRQRMPHAVSTDLEKSVLRPRFVPLFLRTSRLPTENPTSAWSSREPRYGVDFVAGFASETTRKASIDEPFSASASALIADDLAR